MLIKVVQFLFPEPDGIRRIVRYCEVGLHNVCIYLQCETMLLSRHKLAFGEWSFLVKHYFPKLIKGVLVYYLDDESNVRLDQMISVDSKTYYKAKTQSFKLKIKNDLLLFFNNINIVLLR